MKLVGHRGLVVWQKSMDLIPAIYRLASRLPRTEIFGMADQMRRAIISVAANIAEGHGRNGKKEFAYFLGIAQGSTSEIDTLLEAALRLNYIETKEAFTLSEKIADVRRLLFGLQRSLKGS